MNQLSDASDQSHDDQSARKTVIATSQEVTKHGVIMRDRREPSEEEIRDVRNLKNEKGLLSYRASREALRFS